MVRLASCVAAELGLAATVVASLGTVAVLTVQTTRRDWDETAYAAGIARETPAGGGTSLTAPAGSPPVAARGGEAHDAAPSGVPADAGAPVVESAPTAGDAAPTRPSDDAAPVEVAAATDAAAQLSDAGAEPSDAGPEPTVLATGEPLIPRAGGDEPVLLFYGKPDEELLAPLRESPLKLVKLKGGGLTLSFKIELENGAE